MKIHNKVKIKQEVIEMFDKNTNERKFFIKNNNKWNLITEKEYNQIIEVK